MSYPHAGVSGQESESFITFHEPRRNESCKKLTVLGLLVFSFGSAGGEREKKETYNVYSEEKSIVYIKFITFTDEKVSMSPYSTQHPVTTLKAAKLL